MRPAARFFCVDNFSTGTGRNIEHLLGHKAFELLRHDVAHPLFVEVDEIFNLACPASPIHYQKDPVQTTKMSVIGAIDMLGLAKRLFRPENHHRDGLEPAPESAFEERAR